MFHFKVQIEVYNDDRDIEFFIFKRWLESLYADDILQLEKGKHMYTNGEYKESFTILKKLMNK